MTTDHDELQDETRRNAKRYWLKKEQGSEMTTDHRAEMEKTREGRRQLAFADRWREINQHERKTYEQIDALKEAHEVFKAECVARWNKKIEEDA